MTFRLLFLSSALIANLLVWPVSGQVNGRLTGSVQDLTGASVPFAQVALKMPGGGDPILAATTTEAGLFNFSGVSPGFYDLLIRAQGFEEYSSMGIKIDPARETSLPPIKLSPETVRFRVEVVAPLQTLQKENAEVTTTIATDQVRQLPVRDRYSLALIDTQAGVNLNPGPTVINGLRTSYSNVTLDGINIQDNYIRENALDYTPNLVTLDQISEFTLVGSNPNSSMGGGASQVVFVTPSGGKELHGSLFWQNRTTALSANSWFNNKDGIERQSSNLNQGGGSIGGPVLRDKVYFYASYEAYRLRTTPTVNRTILTGEARRGIFTYEDFGGVVQEVNILDAAGVSADPAMQQILESVPGPEKINNFRVGDSRESLLRNTAGYAYPVQGFHDRDGVTFRMDYSPSPTHNLAGSLLWNRQTVSRSDLSNDYSTVPKVRNDDHRKFLSVAWRWNPLPQFTNELRGGFNLAPLTFETSEDFGTAIIDGMIFSNPTNTFRAQGRDTKTYAILDNAVWVSGKHIFQFGFQTQQISASVFNDAGITPTYLLGIGTGNPGLNPERLPGIGLADYFAANDLLASLAGYVNSFGQTFNISSRTSGFVGGAQFLRHYRLNSYSFYFQDDWKVSPSLSLNLGLRYELPSVVDERDSLALLPLVEGRDPVATLLSNATLDFAGSAVGRPWYTRDKNNFGPNVGLAWDLLGDRKTVLRAGYTISYVNDEAIRAINNNVEHNEGLTGVVSATGLSGRVGEGLPSVSTPVFSVPRTFRDNFLLNPFTAFGLPDPELRTPYVQQWSIGIQRQIRDSILEIRYVGNHAVKAFRAFDVNPEIIRESGFLADFERAMENGRLALGASGIFDPNYNPSIPGSQVLTLFPTLVAGGLLDNPVVRSTIQSGEAGQLAFLYHIIGLSGPVRFYENPYSLASNLINNHSNSSYNALQIDIRKRTRSGVQFQGNYTFGRVLSDSNGAAQHRFEEFRDPKNARIDRARPSFDITHAIKANGIYELPFGAGQRFSAERLDWLIGGWFVSGIMNWQSGSPFSILSQRGTLTRIFRSSRNTASSLLTKPELDGILGFRQTADGPYFVSESAIGNDGRGVAPDGLPPFQGQAFLHPGPGQIGGLQQRMFSGPWTFNLDLAVIKDVIVTEGHQIQFRMEALNLFNNVTWLVDDQTVSSVNFGRINRTFYPPRQIQLSLHYRF